MLPQAVLRDDVRSTALDAVELIQKRTSFCIRRTAQSTWQ